MARIKIGDQTGPGTVALTPLVGPGSTAGPVIRRGTPADIAIHKI